MPFLGSCLIDKNAMICSACHQDELVFRGQIFALAVFKNISLVIVTKLFVSGNGKYFYVFNV